MKIIATSDLHGNLPEIKTGFDLLLICGDICPTESHNKEFQRNYISNEFVNWINSLNYNSEYSKVVMVWGNHDFIGESLTPIEVFELERKTIFRLKILNNEVFDFEFPVSDGTDTIKIYGTPYCKTFGRWAFMRNDESLKEIYSKIPKGVDILISHDSPKTNMLGTITEGPWKNYDTGNELLSSAIEDYCPKMFFSGHFHSGNHNFMKVGNTYMANVSYVNEDYEPVNKPLLIEYDEENKKIIENKTVNHE